jgi:hypothetical protein
MIEDNMKLKDQKIIALETKENMMSSMLVLYQSKLRNIMDIYLLTKHQDTETKRKYELLESELRHFQAVVNTQKQMIDSFEETKRQLELSYQMTLKPLQERVTHTDRELEEEKKLRIEYENQAIQFRTKNSLLEHELLTMQSQLQTLLTVTTKSTNNNHNAVTAALSAMTISDSAVSSVSSSISSGTGLLMGNNIGGVGGGLADSQELSRNFRSGMIVPNAANLPQSVGNIQQQSPAIPTRNAILPGKPTVFTGTDTTAATMVSGGTQTNDGHYDDFSIMFNTSIDSSQINLHTLNVKEHHMQNEMQKESRLALSTTERENEDGADALLPIASSSPIRRNKPSKLGGLLKAHQLQQQQNASEINSSDEFAARPLIHATPSNEGLKR